MNTQEMVKEVQESIARSMGTDLAVPLHQSGMSLAPDLILAEAQRAARALQEVIAAKPKKVLINGEAYMEFEDWQILGQFYGFSVKTGDTRSVTIDDVHGAHATALLYTREGQLVGGAEAYCMSDEENWRDKPWFQLASMAQTRAGAKAFRNRLAWVVVMAGYRPTPAEELTDTKAMPTFLPDTPYTGTLASYIPAMNTPKGSGQKSKPHKLVVEVEGSPLEIGGFRLPRAWTTEGVKALIGHPVVVAYEQVGQYRNLKDLTLLDAPPDAEPVGD